MKHDPNATANASAITIGVVYVVCRIAIALFPDLTMAIAQALFHGLVLNNSSSWNLSFGSFVLGLVTSVVGTWLIGYLFARLYNYFLKR